MLIFISAGAGPDVICGESSNLTLPSKEHAAAAYVMATAGTVGSTSSSQIPSSVSSFSGSILISVLGSLISSLGS
jgi:hypothetical protein